MSLSVFCPYTSSIEFAAYSADAALVAPLSLLEHCLRISRYLHLHRRPHTSGQEHQRQEQYLPLP